MATSTSPPANPPSPAPQQRTILAARYELDRRLAQGGMAEVWVAVDLALNRQVAVKWLKPTLAADPVVAERFRREAIAVAGLNHPNIVAVHDAFEHDGRQAVVMQLINGKSLRQLLDDQKRLSPELTIHIGSCVASALDAAHRAGFVHRDVKPGNILITPDGRVLLTDFGIAKGLEPADDDLTSDNVMMGTAKYLSPEQVRGKRLDGRADLYSLGLVLYECLAGRVPFLGQSDADTALARLQRDPTDLNRLRPTLPPGLVDLVHRLLLRNPAHRPATGAELRAELQRVAKEPPPQIDKTPIDAPVRPVVPGEPTRGGTPRSTPTVADAPPRWRPPRDPTPSHGAPRRGLPARGLHQRWTPSLVVIGGLLLAAFIVSLVLMATIDGGTGDRVDVPGGSTAATAATEAAPPADATPAALIGFSAYDPLGEGGENDGLAGLAGADDSPNTEWSTVCYENEFLSGKAGVGIIATLDRPGVGRLTAAVRGAPFALEVYAVAADEVPAGIDGWGTSVDRHFGDVSGTVDVAIATPARHVLLWFTQIGEDPDCSAEHPYASSIGEIAFTP
jgi:serine/threonine-protein kinase